MKCQYKIYYWGVAELTMKPWRKTEVMGRKWEDAWYQDFWLSGLDQKSSESWLQLRLQVELREDKGGSLWLSTLGFGCEVISLAFRVIALKIVL